MLRTNSVSFHIHFDSPIKIILKFVDIFRCDDLFCITTDMTIGFGSIECTQNLLILFLGLMIGHSPNVYCRTENQQWSQVICRTKCPWNESRVMVRLYTYIRYTYNRFVQNSPYYQSINVWVSNCNSLIRHKRLISGFILHTTGPEILP